MSKNQKRFAVTAEPSLIAARVLDRLNPDQIRQLIALLQQAVNQEQP